MGSNKVHYSDLSNNGLLLQQDINVGNSIVQSCKINQVSGAQIKKLLILFSKLNLKIILN